MRVPDGPVRTAEDFVSLFAGQCRVRHGDRPAGTTCLDVQQQAADPTARFSVDYRQKVLSDGWLCAGCLATKVRDRLPAHRVEPVHPGHHDPCSAPDRPCSCGEDDRFEKAKRIFARQHPLVDREDSREAVAQRRANADKVRTDNAHGRVYRALLHAQIDFQVNGDDDGEDALLDILDVFYRDHASKLRHAAGGKAPG